MAPPSHRAGHTERADYPEALTTLSDLFKRVGANGADRTFGRDPYIGFTLEFWFYFVFPLLKIEDILKMRTVSITLPVFETFPNNVNRHR
jgi:hypothetical protein